MTDSEEEDMVRIIRKFHDGEQKTEDYMEMFAHFSLMKASMSYRDLREAISKAIKNH